MNETVYRQVREQTETGLTILEIAAERLSEELPGAEPDAQQALRCALEPLRAAAEKAALLAAGQTE